MKETWKKIKEKISEISPEIVESLNAPATQEDIDTLENTIGQKLPLAFIEYLKIYNGQNHDDFDIPFVGGNSLLTTEEIAEAWQMQMDLFEDESIEDMPENKIQAKYWAKGWIPFASFQGSTNLAIDLSPGINGIHGQVIQWWPGIDYEDDSIVVANSFEEFSKHILSSLESNNYEFEDDTINFKDNWII